MYHWISLSRFRSCRSRCIFLGAGAAGNFYLERESEPEPPKIVPALLSCYK